MAEDTGVLDREAAKAATDPMKACGACCEKAGFSNVEPGSCSCGQLGLDALWN